MTAVIVEDENIASRRLANLIGELAPDIKILAQLTSVESGLKWFKKEKQPDIVFLDIQLNDGYGFDILDALDEHPPVIFTTAFNEYAIRGFKYNGLDYLLKPIDKKDLENALSKFHKLKPVQNSTDKIDQLRSMFTKEYKRRFMIKIGNQFITFKVADIAYFKSNDGLIYLFTNTGKSYPVEYSLDQLEEILNPIQFFRVNRKYVVSVNSVVEIHSYFNSRLLLKLQPKDEEQIIVSRERASNFKKWLDM
ncbi:LytR/AlgR family response regulator transcription factor [Spongiivirga citrea]|uniref:Response regulator n=1 Tax=Spongiivirga citrea TaxID=1481457 RepID=A0A6M0CLV3_9FLAO|nr:LytTR family DNA-binding domain-containing protein [Spongiivirga citrea]NER17004.1 response regulator [Spongiivirga citrea]